MLNESNARVMKKILYPLFFGLTWGMLTYTFADMTSGFLMIVHSFIAIGTFLYALWNILHILEKQVKMKVLIYIALFTVIFHLSTAVVDYYFQGVLATLYGVFLLVKFWKLITKEPVNV